MTYVISNFHSIKSHFLGNSFVYRLHVINKQYRQLNWHFLKLINYIFQKKNYISCSFKDL